MGWSPKEVLVLLFVDVPSVIGAAGELVEAGGFFSLEIVELGLCVFGIPAEGHIETSNRKKELDRWRRVSLTSELVQYVCRN